VPSCHFLGELEVFLKRSPYLRLEISFSSFAMSKPASFRRRHRGALSAWRGRRAASEEVEIFLPAGPASARQAATCAASTEPGPTRESSADFQFGIAFISSSMSSWAFAVTAIGRSKEFDEGTSPSLVADVTPRAS